MSVFKRIRIDDIQEIIDIPFLSQTWGSIFEQTLDGLVIEYFLYREDFLLCLSKNSITGGYYGLPFVDTGAVFPIDKKAVLDVSRFQTDVLDFFLQPITIHIHSGYCPVTGQVETYLSDYQIDLEAFASAAELFQTFRKTLRHILLKKPDFDIEVGCRDGEMKVLYRLYCGTMREKMNIVLPEPLFFWLLEREKQNLLVARRGATIIGFSLFLDIRNSTHYFLSSVLSEYRKLHIAHHVLWKRIQQDMDKKRQAVFLGGTRKGSSLEVFKKAWGAQEYPVYSIVQGNSVSRQARNSRLRQFWRYIPLFLIPFMSKLVAKRMY